MDIARHVIKRISKPRMMDIARHVIKRIWNPRFLSYMASYDVASTIHQSFVFGKKKMDKNGKEKKEKKAVPKPVPSEVRPYLYRCSSRQLSRC
jgi:hypothetical protein